MHREACLGWRREACNVLDHEYAWAPTACYHHASSVYYVVLAIAVSESFGGSVQVTDSGLDSAEVKRRIDQYGYNKLPESTRNPFFVYLGYLWNPLSWAMEVAAILAIILLDYADFCLIIALLLVNATIR